MISRLGRILTGLALLFACTVHAQSNYEPGYIVDDKLDTLKGFIQYRNWMKNPTSISFKSFPESPAVEKTIDEISAFSVHGERYDRATVEKYKYPLPNEDMSFSAIPPTIPVTTFLLNIFDAEKSLYYLRDEGDHTHMYIRDGKGPFVLLIKHRYMIATSSGNRLASLDRYKDQLENFLADCPAVKSRMKLLSFSEKEFIRLFNTYYDHCSTDKPVQHYEREKIGVHFGIMAGVTMTKLGLRDAYAGKMNFDPSIFPTAAVTINVVIPRTKKAVSIYNELAYSGYRSKYLLKGNDLLYSSIYGSDLNYYADANYAKLNTLVRYKFRGNTRLFVNAGISNGILLSQKNGYREREDASPIPITGSIMTDVKKYELGFLGGLGLSYSRLSAELRFESSEGMSIYKELKAPVKRFSLLLGYQF